MSGTLKTKLLWTCIPLVTFVAGGILAVVKKPNQALRSIILHFAGGVIFSVVARNFAGCNRNASAFVCGYRFCRGNINDAFGKTICRERFQPRKND